MPATHWFSRGIQLLALLAVAQVAGVAGCRTERFDKGSCRCVLDYPAPRDAAGEFGLRRCMATSPDDGPHAFDEVQCRTWLASPWLTEPPVDHVAGRVWPSPVRLTRCGRTPPSYPPISSRLPWLVDMPEFDHKRFPSGPYESDELAPEEQEIAAVKSAITRECPDLLRKDCRHRHIAGLAQLVRRLTSGDIMKLVESIGLPLYLVVHKDGALEIATIGQQWWTLPPADRSRLPRGVAGESTRVDIAGLLAEVRWMMGVNRQIVVNVAAMDAAAWGDVWAVLWALDTVIQPSRPDRHWSGAHLPIPPANGEEAIDNIYVAAAGLESAVETGPRWDSDWPSPNDQIRLHDVNLLMTVGWTPQRAPVGN